MEALKIADAAAGMGGDDVLAGWAAHELGTDAFLRGRFDVAERDLQRAAKLREPVDPQGLARSREVLETLRIVTTPPLPWWRVPGRAPIIAAIAGIAIVGAILVSSGVVQAIAGNHHRTDADGSADGAGHAATDAAAGHALPDANSGRLRGRRRPGRRRGR